MVPFYQKENITIFNADCFDVFPDIEGKIDLFLTDPPYGTTANAWDKIPDLDKLWKNFKILGKDSSIYVFNASQPFTSKLVVSNLDWFRYDWVWEKSTPSDFINCNYKPLKIKEDILVFSPAKVGSLSKNPIKYYPQGIREINKLKKNNPDSTWRKNKGYTESGNVLNSNSSYTQKYTGYPTNIIKFPNDKNTSHPTQKPEPLIEYLIKTYSKENDIILDPFMGSGTTLVVAKKLGRKAIGIETSKEYCNMAIKRLTS